MDNNLTLLVVDDIEMNRAVIKRFLENEYNILEAANGNEVLEIIGQQSVDAILLDIIMPQMDGLEVLAHIRERKEYDHVGILVATASKEKTEREALVGGADDIVSKPYDPVVIKARLRNIIAKKKLEFMAQQHKLADYKVQPSVSRGTDLYDAANVIVDAAKMLVQKADNKELQEELHKLVLDKAKFLSASLDPASRD